MKKNARGIVMLIGFLSGTAVRAKTAIVDGKVYTLTEKERPTCGSPGSPQYSAAVFTMSSARGLAEQLHQASCANRNRSDCSPADIEKSGIKAIFITIRDYPSRYTDEGCKKLRESCSTNCDRVFSSEDCLIECNQYESYNR